METSASDIEAAIVQRYVSAAGVVILLYDILINLDQEIRLIWRGPLSVAKALFLINRYSVPVALIFNQYMMAGFAATKTDEFCAHYILGLEIIQVLEGGGIIPGMLLLRVYALYSRSQRLLGLLLFFVCASVVTSLILGIIAMKQDNDQIVWVPVMNMCMTSGDTRYLWVVWVLLTVFELVFESIIITLLVCKAYAHARSQFRTPIISLLIRDGVAYFVVMLLLLIFCLITYTALPYTWYLIGAYITWSLHATLISRIYLNLRNVSNSNQWAASTAIREPGPGPAEQPHTGASRHQCATQDHENSYEMERMH